MRRFFAEMNPTVRGFLIILAVVFAILLLNLQGAVFAISMLMRIAFFLAIAFFLFLVWRERRSDIESWSPRARNVFYGAAALIVIDIAFVLVDGFPAGVGALAFVLVLLLCGYSMFRVWRDEHTYG